jgi:hypothetical protein
MSFGSAPHYCIVNRLRTPSQSSVSHRATPLPSSHVNVKSPLLLKSTRGPKEPETGYVELMSPDAEMPALSAFVYYCFVRLAKFSVPVGSLFAVH